LEMAVFENLQWEESSSDSARRGPEDPGFPFEIIDLDYPELELEICLYLDDAGDWRLMRDVSQSMGESVLEDNNRDSRRTMVYSALNELQELGIVEKKGCNGDPKSCRLKKEGAAEVLIQYLHRNIGYTATYVGMIPYVIWYTQEERRDELWEVLDENTELDGRDDDCQIERLMEVDSVKNHPELVQLHSDLLNLWLRNAKPNDSRVSPKEAITRVYLGDDPWDLKEFVEDEFLKALRIGSAETLNGVFNHILDQNAGYALQRVMEHEINLEEKDCTEVHPDVVLSSCVQQLCSFERVTNLENGPDSLVSTFTRVVRFPSVRRKWNQALTGYGVDVTEIISYIKNAR